MITKINRQFLLGIGLIVLTSSIQAANYKTDKKPQPLPAPVIPSGSRLFPGDPAKNEFYILGQGQPTPQLEQKKGHLYVNTQPLKAGADPYTILTAKPVDTLLNQDIVAEPADAKVNADKMNVDKIKPVALPKQPEEVKEKSNFQKAKDLLHRLTQKMAEKKKHGKLKVKMAGKNNITIKKKTLALKVRVV